MATKKNLERLRTLGIDIKLDFILNHASVLSEPFQDILKRGRESEFTDFFIDWNLFWEGCGELNEQGILVPYDEYVKEIFFRKPGLPVLKVRLPDGKEIHLWNTFYQEVRYGKIEAQDIMLRLDIDYNKACQLADSINDRLRMGMDPREMELDDKLLDLIESGRKYLGQMDLNIKSPLVWDFYDNTLRTLALYGAEIVRLDAFAYAPKTAGKKNFLNEPDTWDLLGRVKTLADRYNLQLLPEIHSRYEEGVHRKIVEQGYATYDFFLPGLIIDAIERKTGSVIKKWISEILENRITAVNMLGCHDGIPLLDLKGLLPDKQIQSLKDTVAARGGRA